MSTSTRELKQQQQRPPLDPPPDTPRSPIGSIVAFAIYPDTLVPATVDAARADTIDCHYTAYERVKVDTRMESGLYTDQFEIQPKQKTHQGVRHLDPCVRGNGPPLPAPQSGHFTPGTWFDPSPFTITIACGRDPVSEVRLPSRLPGVLGTKVQDARPGETATLGPFDDFAQACEAHRIAAGQWDSAVLRFTKRV